MSKVSGHYEIVNVENVNNEITIKNINKDYVSYLFSNNNKIMIYDNHYFLDLMKVDIPDLTDTSSKIIFKEYDWFYKDSRGNVLVKFYYKGYLYIDANFNHKYSYAGIPFNIPFIECSGKVISIYDDIKKEYEKSNVLGFIRTYELIAKYGGLMSSKYILT